MRLICGSHTFFSTLLHSTKIHQLDSTQRYFLGRYRPDLARLIWYMATEMMLNSVGSLLYLQSSQPWVSASSKSRKNCQNGRLKTPQKSSSRKYEAASKRRLPPANFPTTWKGCEAASSSLASNAETHHKTTLFVVSAASSASTPKTSPRRKLSPMPGPTLIKQNGLTIT